MAKTRKEKEQHVKDLKQKFSDIRGAVLVDYRGLDVEQMTELRAKLQEEGIDFVVVKNTLAEIAAKEVGVEGLEDYLTGPIGIAFGYDDPVLPAKILKDFSKENDDLEFRGGILQGSAIDEEKVKELASLPSREELLAQVVGTMQAPISGFVNAAQGTIRNFVYAVENYRKDREEEEKGA